MENVSNRNWHCTDIQGEWGVYDDATGCCLMSENHGEVDGFDPRSIAYLAASAPELRRVVKLFLEISENPAPRADDRKMQLLSVTIQAHRALQMADGNVDISTANA